MQYTLRIFIGQFIFARRIAGMVCLLAQLITLVCREYCATIAIGHVTVALKTRWGALCKVRPPWDGCARGGYLAG